MRQPQKALFLHLKHVPSHSPDVMYTLQSACVCAGQGMTGIQLECAPMLGIHISQGRFLLLTVNVFSTVGSMSMQTQSKPSSMQSWHGSEHIRGTHSVCSKLGTCTWRRRRQGKQRGLPRQSVPELNLGDRRWIAGWHKLPPDAYTPICPFRHVNNGPGRCWDTPW